MAKAKKNDKKAKKAKKNVAAEPAVVAVVEEVFGAETVSPAVVANSIGESSPAMVTYANKGNGGSPEAETKKAETFNRNGVDALMTAGLPGNDTLVIDTTKPAKKSRIALTGGYRGTVREMILAGNTGEEIIKKIAGMYEATGQSHEYGMNRGKRILQDMLRDQKRGIFGVQENVTA